jgi:hypothetical protein
MELHLARKGREETDGELGEEAPAHVSEETDGELGEEAPAHVSSSAAARV